MLQPRKGLWSTRRTQDDVQRAVPGSSPGILRPTGSTAAAPPPHPALSPSPSMGLPAGAWRGQGQLLGSSGEGAGLPGLLPWGRLENKQAGSLTSDCRVENPVGVDVETLPWGKVGCGGEGPGKEGLPGG